MFKILSSLVRSLYGNMRCRSHLYCQANSDVDTIIGWGKV